MIISLIIGPLFAIVIITYYSERSAFAPVIFMKLETKNFYKTVGALVLPIALQNLINVAVTSADVVMLGRVGETVLSGSSLAGQVQFILTLFIFGLTSGAAVLTAQYWGKKDMRTIEKVMGIAFRFSIIVSVIFLLAVQIFPAQVMSIFTPEQPVIDEGAKYLRIVSFTYLLCAVTQVYLNVMRSVERVVIATVTYSVSLIVNIVINGILIFGLLGFPRLGIVGAAIGTLIARIVEVLIVVVYAKTKSILNFKLRDLFVRDKLLFQDFIRYAIPVTLNELMWGTGCSVIAVVIGHMGQAAVAANSVAQVTRQLATVVSFGIAAAAAVLIGKAIGEDNYEEAQKYGTRFVKLSIVAGLAGALVVLVARPIVLQVMTLTPTAQGYLSTMMFIMAYFVVAQAYNTTMVVGIFRAGGDTRFGLVLDVVTMWGCSILFGAIAAFVFHWSVEWVYVLLLSDEIIKIPLTTWRYKTRVWLRNVTR